MLGWLHGADPSMVCGDSGESHLPIHLVTLAWVLSEPSAFQVGAESIPWLSEGRSACRVSVSSTVTFLPSITSTQTVSQRPSQLAANTKTSLETRGTLDSTKKRRSTPRRREQECDPAGQPWLANGSWTKLALSPLLFTIAKQCLAPFILASGLGKMYKNFSPWREF